MSDTWDEYEIVLRKKGKKVATLSLRNYLSGVNYHGRQRAKTQGEHNVDNATYVAGAMVLMFALHIQHLIPSSWVFLSMVRGSEDVFGDEPRKPEWA